MRRPQVKALAAVSVPSQFVRSTIKGGLRTVWFRFARAVGLLILAASTSVSNMTHAPKA